MEKYIIKIHDTWKNHGATMDYYSKPRHWELLPYKKISEWESELMTFQNEESCFQHIAQVRIEMMNVGGKEYRDKYLFEIVKLY